MTDEERNSMTDKKKTKKPTYCGYANHDWVEIKSKSRKFDVYVCKRCKSELHCCMV